MTDMTETLPDNLQDQILALLVFDDKQGKLVKSIVPLEAWASDSAFKLLINRVYEYIDKYKRAPGSTINSLIENLSLSEDKQELLTVVINRSRIIYDDNMDVEYVIDSIDKFCRQNQLSTSALKTLEYLHDGHLEKVEEIFHLTAKQTISSFDPGKTLLEGAQEIFSKEEQVLDRIHLDIKAFDERELNPRRKELFLFVAPPKRGKSWFLIHVATQALIQNKKVLHITLEMSEKIVTSRYLQTIFGLTMKDTKESPPIIFFAENGDFKIDTPSKRPTIQSEENNILKNLSGSHSYFNKNLRIKQFPTGGLSLSQLNACLDSLEMKNNWIPDVLIIDYVDLMKVKSKGGNDYRIELGQVYKELRGLAVERNLMLVTASQSNRGSAEKEKIEGTDIAEDYSKIATADVVITYAQKETEKASGLARLYVANSRNTEDRFEIMISQAYSIGKFVLDSAELTRTVKDKYNKQLQLMSN